MDRSSTLLDWTERRCATELCSVFCGTTPWVQLKRTVAFNLNRYIRKLTKRFYWPIQVQTSAASTRKLCWWGLWCEREEDDLLLSRHGSVEWRQRRFLRRLLDDVWICQKYFSISTILCEHKIIIFTCTVTLCTFQIFLLAVSRSTMTLLGAFLCVGSCGSLARRPRSKHGHITNGSLPTCCWGRVALLVTANTFCFRHINLLPFKPLVANYTPFVSVADQFLQPGVTNLVFTSKQLNGVFEAFF